MKPLTHFKTTKVLRNIFLSLGAIFALAITAHAQNLYVSANVPADLTKSSSSRRMGRRYLRFGARLTLEGWPLTASAIFSRRTTPSPTTSGLGEC